MPELPERPFSPPSASPAGSLDPSQMRSLLERVKELNCLYEISRLFAESEPEINVFLDRVCEIMRFSWQYPDITRVRIEFGGKTYQSAGFRLTPWKQQAPIETGLESEGSITVVYLQERPDENEGPFLKEERRLIDTAARELGTNLRAKLLDQARHESEERYAALIENAGDGVLIIQNEAVRFANRAFAHMLGCTHPDEVIGHDVSLLLGTDLVSDPMNHILSTTFDTGTSRQEMVLHRRDGSPLALDITATVVPFRDGPAIMAIIRDITIKRFLEQKIVSISERERAAIGQDLHDGICQYLAGIAAAGGALERRLTELGHLEADTAGTIRKTAIEALEQTRAMARTLSPLTITPDGLVTGLRDLAYQIEKLFGLTCIVECTESILINDAASATQLYRIAQEAISNAVRHGQAETIRITLSRDADRVTLAVIDDGIGIQPTAWNSGGIGLKIMDHRAHMIGALLQVENRSLGGTIVRCLFKNHPIPPAEPAGS
jgi:two-component system, LuxR family, sensor kinase FixL